MDEVLRTILQRLDALERTTPNVRLGEVTDDTPLTIALGGSDVEIPGVATLAPVRTGDAVIALTYGNGVIVLGTVDGTASDAVRFTGSETISTTPWTAFNPLTLTSLSGAAFTTTADRLVVPAAGLYVVTATLENAAGGQRRAGRLFHVNSSGSDIAQLDGANDIIPSGQSTAESVKLTAIVHCAAGEGIRVDEYSDDAQTGTLTGYMARLGA